MGTITIPEVVEDTDARDAWALRLRIGPSAIVTGPTAARLQGIPLECPLILAIAPVTHHARAAGARILRRPPAHATINHHGVELTTAPEAVLDTLLAMPPHGARELLWKALQKEWITVEFMMSTLAHRRKRQQHSKRLRRLCVLASSGSHSEAERRMATIIRQHELGHWRSNYPLKDAQERVIALLDFALVSKRIAIEVDGRAFHSDHASFERDRIRQNIVQNMGWVVLRFTWEELKNHRARVVQTVRGALARENPVPLRLRADCAP